MKSGTGSFLKAPGDPLREPFFSGGKDKKGKEALSRTEFFPGNFHPALEAVRLMMNRMGVFQDENIVETSADIKTAPQFPAYFDLVEIQADV